MKDTKISRVAVLVLAAFILTVFITGCKGKNKSDVTEIIVGTGSSYNPYTYLDENNELTGYEKAVLDEVDRRLPEYSFTYRISDFTNILLSLETGAIDIAAHQFEFNPEREKKYLYGEEGYTIYDKYLVVREDDNSINSFHDLKGKKVIVPDTSNNNFYIANTWNEANGNIFEIVFASSTPLTLEDIENKRADAFIALPRMVPIYKEQYDAKIKVVGERVSDSQAYHLYNKQNGHELKSIIDGVLREMKADGTLSKISIEWLGGDYVPK